MTNFDGQCHSRRPWRPAPALDWTPGNGTYQVNADCTETAHIDVPSMGDFVNLRFVVAPFSGPDRAFTSVGIRLL